MSDKNQAERKVNIAIDKMIDLQQDFNFSQSILDRCQRILDQLNDLRSIIESTEKVKKLS